MNNVLFLKLQLSNLLFLLSFSTRRHMSMAPLVIFFQISLKNSELKTTHNTIRDCRVHFFRQPFSKQLYKTMFTTLVNTYEVERSCMWTALVMTCPCHRSTLLCLPHPLSCRFLFTFSIKVNLGFESIFSRVNEPFDSIEIEIVIVSNKRTVPSMGLGSRLHLPFWGSAIVFNYSCNYN